MNYTAGDSVCESKISCVCLREKLYEEKLRQQQQELQQLHEERQRLMEIQDKIQDLQWACPDLQVTHTEHTPLYFLIDCVERLWCQNLFLTF